MKSPDTTLIRAAKLTDMGTLTQLKRAVWPDEPADPIVISLALQTPSHKTFLAMIDGEPAGFVSCFVTQSAAKKKRFEIDLLAVHPDFRRRGLAGQLLAKALNFGAIANVDCARALVSPNNVASQASFAQQGFTADGQTHSLFLSNGAAMPKGGKPKNAHFVQVSTFNYRGIWVEGQLSELAFSTALVERNQKALDLVGILIPTDDDTHIGHAQARGYEKVGSYQWWQKEVD